MARSPEMVVREYFRSPGPLAGVHRVGRVSEEPGFFLFGPETVCYGRSSSFSAGKAPVNPLYDALDDVRIGGGIVVLPLDPGEIIENLRRELYLSDGNGGQQRLGRNSVAGKVYYGLRPFLPVSIRRHLQRVHLGNWEKLSFPQWPVDRTVERILERLLALTMKAQGLERMPFVWFWPEGASSCTVVTHDVEELAGRNFCAQLMDIDESAGIKSSFQIVPEGRYPVPQGLLEEMRDRGFEINIHDLNHDGRLFANREEFLRRVKRINAYGRRYDAHGFRSGALYRVQEWYDDLEFSYDMSVPSVGHLEAQRGGCCSSMPFFIGEILELPLTTTQDYSLFHILGDYSIDLWRRQTQTIGEKHGLASFIVHPDYVIERRARAVYHALLEHLVEMREQRRTWIALPGEVDRWWRERSQMSVVYDGGGWRIEGAGNERARLAWAALVGDDLAFSVEGRAVA